MGNNNMSPGTLLWRHSNPESTQMHKYMQSINDKHGLELATYRDLHKWTTSNIADFWESLWHHLGVRAECQFDQVISSEVRMFPRPTFFSGARLNFAQNLLYPIPEVDPDTIAVIAATESTRDLISWRRLRDRVQSCQQAMTNRGVTVGDRIAGVVGNHVNALVAMLAATSIGAIWTAVSPDTGATAILDRMRQIEPVMIFCDNAVVYNGKTHPNLDKISAVCTSLPTLRSIVIYETVPDLPTALHQDLTHISMTYGGFKYVIPKIAASGPTFVQLPPDHPVYILYSSGTTGAPKCIVHGAIGTLLQHKKEHMLHCDVRPGDRLFYFTTCTWMMWHWLVSGLASGATIVLYDGSPFRHRSSDSNTSVSYADDLAMPRLIQELQITHFGTSAKYLSMLEQKKLFPLDSNISLKSLQAVYSTGSPLAPSTFAYVYEAFGDVNLGSITGGTDIISLFGAPCPLTPVYCGEIQVCGLGMAVRAWDYQGHDVSDTGEAGDLICDKPFICQPVRFWADLDDAKYKSAYYETFPEVWHHGDFIKFNPATGGLYMLGRSDGILKPSGVRFGSAEIYNLLLQHYAQEVEDALCIGRRRESDTDETVVLFLKLRHSTNLKDLSNRIKTTVRDELSARHVPGIIDQTPEIPMTTNGKKIESAVKQILCGINIKTSASVANPECLEWYNQWARDHDD